MPKYSKKFFGVYPDLCSLIFLDLMFSVFHSSWKVNSLFLFFYFSDVYVTPFVIVSKSLKSCSVFKIPLSHCMSTGEVVTDLSSSSQILSWPCHVYWWIYQKNSSFLLQCLYIFLWVSIFLLILLSALSYFLPFFSIQKLNMFIAVILDTLSANSKISVVPDSGFHVYFVFSDWFCGLLPY